MTDEIVIPSGDGSEDPAPELDDAVPGDELPDPTRSRCGPYPPSSKPEVSILQSSDVRKGREAIAGRAKTSAPPGPHHQLGGPSPSRL